MPRASLFRHLLTGSACILAGVLIAGGVGTSRLGHGYSRDADLATLVEHQQARKRDISTAVEAMRSRVDELTTQNLPPTQLVDEAAATSLQQGLIPVTGPGVTVVLKDAPPDVKPAGIDEDLLVVHQQDIQAVLNAMWAAGAEAVSIQDQRVIATTSIKCVGNTVVIHGVPYAPPYVIKAIGDPTTLDPRINADPVIKIYQQYALFYGLGWELTRAGKLELPGYAGRAKLTNATSRPR